MSSINTQTAVVLNSRIPDSGDCKSQNPDTMGGFRNRVVCRLISGTCFRMNRRKTLGENLLETPLKRCLSTLDITLLGIGHMVGAGIYVLTGTVASNMAGPAIIISFLLAGLASLLASLCYAEFGARVPKAGSAYVYTYVTIGEFWAFIIGWNIVLEHMIGAASVARAWSGYVDSLAGGVIANTTAAVVGEMHDGMLAKTPDFLAFVVCLAYCSLLAIGVKGSAYFNGIFTCVNIGVMFFVVAFGLYWADYRNWTDYGGFAPFGFRGILSGAATCFYAYVGFDSIATSGEEARNPSFSIPVATFISMSLVTIGYVAVGATLTLMVPYTTINPAAALPDAFAAHGITWARIVVSVGALAGMTTTLFGSLFSLPRGIYAMAQDGLLFKVFARVHEKTQVPLITMAVSGFLSALIALLFDIEKLVEFMSIGTLMAYTIVSAAVIILRYRPLPRSDALPLSTSPGSTPDGDKDLPEFLNEGGRLKVNFYWLEKFIGRHKPGKVPNASVLVFTVSCGVASGTIKWGSDATSSAEWWTILLITISTCAALISVFLMTAHQQVSEDLRFKVPLVPYIPLLSIMANVALMVNLNPLVLYFGYGMHHSVENCHATSYSELLKDSRISKGDWGSTQSSQMVKQDSEDTTDE